jgi:hypothetical protein
MMQNKATKRAKLRGLLLAMLCIGGIANSVLAADWSFNERHQYYQKDAVCTGEITLSTHITKARIQLVDNDQISFWAPIEGCDVHIVFLSSTGGVVDSADAFGYLSAEISSMTIPSSPYAKAEFHNNVNRTLVLKKTYWPSN